MPLDVDPLTIRRIWIIPWELDQGLFGVAYEFTDGGSSCVPVGTMLEASAVVREIERQRGAAKKGDNVIDLMTEAGKHRRG